MKSERALISVSDKSGILDFARELASLGVDIISTGGTAKLLADNGVKVTEISDYTGFPEMLDGRVKTLHPKIHGGLLGRRSLPAHVSKMQEHGIEPIDLVVVNLYPFRETIAKAGVTSEQARGNIDIGGPCMIRASAKNFIRVAPVVDPEDYPAILSELKADNGRTSLALRFRLAQKAFAHTADYDRAIADYLGRLSAADVSACYRSR